MSLLLHAITPTETGQAPAVGLRGYPLVRIEEPGLSVWATEFQAKPDQLTREDLLNHHRLVSQLDLALDACLPARLPSWFATREELHHRVATRSTELQAGLERVRGRAELAITALWTLEEEDAPEGEEDAPEAEAATPGTRYLFQRRHAIEASDRRRERARQLADELEHLSQPELVEMRRQLCPSRAVALSAALLVPRSSASAVKARFPHPLQDVRILVNGPWPAYTFAAVG